MELGLTLAIVAGILLFAIGFIRFVLASFGHHFVTGIISLVPVLNLLVVPSVWHRSGKLLLTGLVGLSVAIGAWFAGGDKAIARYLDRLSGRVNVQAPAGQSATALQQAPMAIPPASQNSLSSSSSSSSTQAPSPQPGSAVVVEYAPSKPMAALDESSMQPLPPRALYRLGFEEIPLQNITTVLGRIVRITDQNLNLIEGRVVNVNPSSVLIQPTGKQGAELEVPVPNIKKLSLMIRQM